MRKTTYRDPDGPVLDLPLPTRRRAFEGASRRTHGRTPQRHVYVSTSPRQREQTVVVT